MPAGDMVSVSPFTGRVRFEAMGRSDDFRLVNTLTSKHSCRIFLSGYFTSNILVLSNIVFPTSFLSQMMKFEVLAEQIFQEALEQGSLL